MARLRERITAFARELYRRRVPRVVVAYLIAGGVAFNGAEFLTEIFTDLPDYTMQLVLVLLLVGLPIAIGLAWALDITSGGIVRTPAEPDRAPRLVVKRRRRLAPVLLGLTFVALVVITVLRFVDRDGPNRPGAPVAVIPSVTGVAGSAPLEDALAVVVTTRLESAGWNTVDVNTVREQGRLPLEPAAVARRAGAGFFVDARLEVDGERATARTSLYAVDDAVEEIGTGGREGDAADVLRLVDDAVAQLTGFAHGLLDPFPTNPSPERVAIMPGVVSGSDGTEDLGEGVAVLLAAKLEQLGWPASDPRAVFGILAQPAIANARSPYALSARRAYANFFVETRIELGAGATASSGWRWPWQAPPEIRIEAQLFHVDEDGRPFSTVARAGRRDDIAQLVAGIAEELAREMDIGQRGARVADDAPTGSLAALEAYIEGGRLFRAGEYQRSAEAFTRTVESDPDFSLAWYRLSIAAEWAGDVAAYNPYREEGIRLAIATDRCGSAFIEEAGSSSADCADVAESRRLTWRTRLLAEARRMAQVGDLAAAHRVYDWIRVAHPDDYEATFQLAEILFHHAPRDGSDVLASDSLWQGVLNFQPRDFGALLHAARLDAVAGRQAELESLASSALEIEPDGIRAIEMKAYVAFAQNDAARIDSTLLALSRLPEPRSIWSIGGRVAMYTGNLAGAARIMRLLTDSSRSTDARVLGHVTVAHLFAALGLHGAARNELAQARALDALPALVFTVSLHEAPFSPRPSRTELETLRDRLLATTPGSPGEAPVTELTVHDSVYDRLRLFTLGLLSLRLGEEFRVRSYVSEIQSLPGGPEAIALGEQLGQNLLAWMEFEKGNYVTAEQLIEGIEVEAAQLKLELSPFFALTMVRFLRARIFEERGRIDDALRQFASFHATSVYDLAWLAPAAFERARLLDERGEGTAAAREYRRVIALWPEPDPQLSSIVDQAHQRLRALSATVTAAVPTAVALRAPSR